MEKTYNMKKTKRFESSLKSISSEDKHLTAEIIKKIDLLEENKTDQLNIVQIKRSKPKHKIMEIKIKSPQSYRIFYVYILKSENDILLVDGRRKKVDKFTDKYFKELDIAIDDYLDKYY